MPVIRPALGAAALLLVAQIAVFALPATPGSAATATPTPTSTAPTATPRPAAREAERPAPPLRERFKPKDGDRITYLSSGAIYLRRVVPAEPWRINVLLFDLTAPEFDVKTAIGDGWLSGRTRTSYLVAQEGALAGVNGDLFNDNGVPQGLTLTDGRVAVAPKHRATFAWSRDGKPFIGYFTPRWTWDARVTTEDGASFPLQLLNWPCEYDWICMHNEFGGLVPAVPGDVKVAVGPTGNVYKLVESSALKVPTGTTVLQGTGKGAAWLLEHIALDDTVTISTETDPPLADYEQGISGGPILLRDGEFVQDCMCMLNDCRVAELRGPSEIGPRYAELFDAPLCEDFDFDWKLSHYFWSLLPRTVVGYDKAQQTLIVAQVDGYQPGYSRGMTQREVADLMLEFGTDTAMELDGGGSSTMVVDDAPVNRPSDGSGERYVANALLFFWREPEAVPQVGVPVRGE
jgi:hypothetical protein